MHKKIIKIMVIVLFNQGCQHTIPKIENKKEIVMNLESKYFIRYKDNTNETFDFKIYKNMINQEEGRSTMILEDGTKIQMSEPLFKDMTYGVERTTTGFIRISPVKPFFIEIVKIFSPLGKLIKQGKFISNINVGISQEFNENGKLIEEIDYDKKDWSKYYYSDILKFLDKEGVIDLKTGRGRGTFSFYLDREKEQWHVEVIESPENGYVATLYTLDANTLKVLEVKKEQRGIE